MVRMNGGPHLRKFLAALLPGATTGLWPPEARLLYDLQRVCVAHERPVEEPKLAEWVYSHFRGPLVRQLPDQPLVLTVQHLRKAAGRLPAAVGAIVAAASATETTASRNIFPTAKSLFPRHATRNGASPRGTVLRRRSR